MRIASWNINGLRARLEFVQHWLRERKPDVVGLQELKLSDDQFPHEAFESLGYQAVTHGQKAWNGVAVLSREPAEVSQRGLPGQDELGARMLTVAVGGISFTTLYCPNGKNLDHEDYATKLAWYDALVEHLDERHDMTQPTIVCGDFNICPGPLDSWNEERLAGHIFHTNEERVRFRRLLDCGLTDVYRERNPSGQDFSWWDYRGGAFHRKQGLRIDFLLASRSASDRIESVEIDREYRKKKQGLTASDHAPVYADLDEP